MIYCTHLQNYGNMRIIDGTLRANRNMSRTSYLISAGGQSCGNQQASCNENLGFEGLDCSQARRLRRHLTSVPPTSNGTLPLQLIAGGLWVGTTMGANIGPQMFVVNFTQAIESS
jgi:hypothetical protein